MDKKLLKSILDYKHPEDKLDSINVDRGKRRRKPVSELKGIRRFIRSKYNLWRLRKLSKQVGVTGMRF